MEKLPERQPGINDKKEGSEPPPFTRSLFSNREGHGDSVVMVGLLFAVSAIVLEFINVAWYGRPFDMSTFGLMALQLLGGMGGGVGAREILTNWRKPPG